MVSFAEGRGRADRPGGRRRPFDLRRYAGAGALSTVAWLVLFVAWRGFIGAYAANILALLICCAATTSTQWQFSLRLDDRRAARTIGTIGFVVSAAVTTIALLVAGHVGEHSELGQVGALLVGTGVAAFVRLLAAQAWVLHHAPPTNTTATGSSPDRTLR